MDSASLIRPLQGDAPGALSAECGWDGTLLLVSPGLLRVLGWDRAPGGADLYHLVHAESRPALEQLWHTVVQARRQGHPVPVRLAGKLPAARRYFLHLSYVAVGQGERRRMAIHLTPDDGRQDLLDALESAQNRFSFIYENTSDLVVMLSDRDEILAANPAFESFTGLEVESFYRGEHGWADILFPEDLDAVIKAFHHARDARTRAQVMCRIRGRGDFFWHDLAIHPFDSSSGQRGLFCAARDVHHLKLAEQSQQMQAMAFRDRQMEALRRMERMKGMVGALAAVQGGRLEFLRGLRNSLSGNFPGLMVLVDIPGPLQEAPGEASGAAGGLLDSPVMRLLHEFRLPVTWSRPADAPEGVGGDFDAFLGVPVIDAPGTPAGVIVVASDEPHEFTPVDVDTLQHAAQLLAAHIGQWRREEERDRLQRQVQSERKMEALGRLAGGISHDFNNLISIILNYAQFAMQNLPEGSPAAADMQVVRQTAEQAAELTRKLMQFARAKPAESVEVDLNAVVRETLSVLGHGVRKDIVIETELAPGLPVVSGDPTQLKQIVLNLGLNAAQAIGAKPGKVTVRTLLRPVPRHLRESMPAAESEGRKAVLLEVVDNGPGISPEILPRIFEAFTTTKREGVGLGLSIVKNVATQCGGAVEVESEPGQGSTFRVWLPSRVRAKE